MSLQFSDTTNLKGLAQLYEREIGVQYGEVTGNTTRLKAFTADTNVAWDSYLRMVFPTDGTWKLDDSNHTKMPEVITDLVANQRRYPFTTDEQGNLILDIFKVYIKHGDVFQEIHPVDPDTESGHHGFYDGQDTTGTPYLYDKTANVIILDPVPGENVSGGLKVSINREAMYFTHSDTDRKPGAPGHHHAWFYLVPALDYARRHSLESHNRIEAAVMKLEEEIKGHYSRRNRDQRTVLRGKPIIFH